MSGPIYSFVRLFLTTLYPAYYSFKAVKNKSVKEYVKWMMYWIIYAFFIALESVLDPFVSFWLPFYCEVKLVLLLYLVAPATRGSGVIYRRWLHPFLCDKEEEIDAVLQRVKEQGTNTALSYVHRGFHWAAGLLVTTAIRGGGGLVHQLKKSYSLTDLRSGGGRDQFDRNRFTDVTEEEEGGYFSSPSSRRRYQSYNQLIPRSPERYLSNESLSSGYNTDFFPGPAGEPLNTEDYELWSSDRFPSPSRSSPPHHAPHIRTPISHAPPSSTQARPSTSPILSPPYIARQKVRARNRPTQAPVSDDDDDTFYDTETLQTPFGTLRPGDLATQLTSPSSSCYPSDRESLHGDCSDTDWERREEEEEWEREGTRTPVMRRNEEEEEEGAKTPTLRNKNRVESLYSRESFSSLRGKEGEATPTRSPSPRPQAPLRRQRDTSESRFSFWSSRRKW